MTTHLQLFEPGFTSPFESAFRRFFSPARFDTDLQALDMRLDALELPKKTSAATKRLAIH